MADTFSKVEVITAAALRRFTTERELAAVAVMMVADGVPPRVASARAFRACTAVFGLAGADRTPWPAPPEQRSRSRNVRSRSAIRTSSYRSFQAAHCSGAMYRALRSP